MKTILAATDFSRASDRALSYAAELALHMRATLILFHAYHLPVIIGAEPELITTAEQQRRESEKALAKCKARLEKVYGSSLHIKTEQAMGLAGDLIPEKALELKADLIAAGTHGAGYLEEVLIGSVATSLIRNSKVPVLTVGSRVKFKGIGNIIFATDYSPLSGQQALKPLKAIARAFQAHIHVLHASGPGQQLPVADEQASISRFLKPLPHSFHEASDTVVKAVNDYVTQQKADLVVMMPHQRSFLQSLFHRSTTKAMAFHSKTALLTIHDV